MDEQRDDTQDLLLRDAISVRCAHRQGESFGPVPLDRDLEVSVQDLVNACRKRLSALRSAEKSYREVGERTSTNHETVRRYLTCSDPGLRFVMMAIRAYGLSAEWVLFGRGPVYLLDVPRAVCDQEADAHQPHVRNDFDKTTSTPSAAP